MTHRWHRWHAVGLMGLVVACAPSEPSEEVGASRAALASVPVLVAPFDFALIGTTTPTLVANATSTSAAADVTFEWSVSPMFIPSTTAVVPGVTSGSDAAFTLPAALPAGTTHHWRARAVDGSGASAWSSSRSFTVGPPDGGAAWQATTEAQFRAATLSQLSTTLGGAIIGFSATPVFFDDFESGGLSAWTLANTAPPVFDITNAASAGAPSGTRVMKVVDTDTGSAGAIAMHDWGTVLGRGAIDFWSRVDAEGPRFSGGFLRGPTTVFAASLIWGGPPLALRYVNDRSFVTELAPPVPVAANAWHHYRIEYLDRASYDLFLDGQRVATALLLQQNNGDITRVSAHSSSTFISVINDYELDDVGVYPGVLTGTWTSPPISAADLGSGYGALSWSTPAAGLRLRVEVLTGAASWGLLPDAELPGNAAGFTTSAVSLTGLSATAHPELRVQAVLTRLVVLDASPQLDQVTVSGPTTALTTALTLAPALASVPPRGTLGLAVTGGSPPFTFSMASAPSGGSVSPAGVYTAGATCEVTDAVTVQDSTLAASGSVISVTGCVLVSPAAVTVSAGGAVSFLATGGSGTGFGWSVTTGSGGTINTGTGQYLAGPGIGTDVVTARDSLGNLGTATVTVTAADAGVDAGIDDAGIDDAGIDDAGIDDAGAADAGTQHHRTLGVGCGCSSVEAPFLLALLSALFFRRARAPDRRT